MSGGGSQVTNTTPWSQAQPYLLDLMGKAQGLYGTTSPQYSNPSSNFGFNQTTGALGGAINGTNAIGGLSTSLTPGVSSAISSELSGTPDYTAVNNALDAANTQTWNSFNNTELPQLNQRASFLGNPSGAIKDLNWATSQIGNNMNLNAQQAYLGQYNDALARQANAASLGTNIAQTAGQQSLQGASLYPTIAQMPQQNLADYANLISSTGGKFGSGSTSINPGAAGTAANIIGGLTAGTGLLNQLTGATPATGGLVGQVGSLFGGTAGIGTGATAATNAAAGSIGTSVAPTVASDSAGIAAGNDAWLAGQPAATSSGLGGGLGASTAGAAGGAAGDAGLSSVGVDAATADPSIAGLGGAGAGSGAAAGGAGSGLGAGAGAALALAPLGITALLASHTGAVQLGDDYWKKYSNPTGSYGSGTGNYTQNFLELANGINQGDMPPDYLLQQYPGLYQAAAQMRQAQSGPMSAYWGTGGGKVTNQNRV